MLLKVPGVLRSTVCVGCENGEACGSGVPGISWRSWAENWISRCHRNGMGVGEDSGSLISSLLTLHVTSLSPQVFATWSPSARM